MNRLNQLSGEDRILSALRNSALILSAAAAVGCMESPIQSASTPEDAVAATAALGSTDSVSNFLQYEAEDAIVLAGGVGVGGNASGYFGTSYIAYPHASGGVVMWNPQAPIFAEKEYTVSFRYSNGSGADAVANVSINGTNYPGLRFPRTSSWSTWSTVSVVQKLEPTVGVISVKVTSNRGMDLDCVIIN